MRPAIPASLEAHPASPAAACLAVAHLAPRAIPRSSAGHADLVDRRAAAVAGLTAAPVDLELVLGSSLCAVGEPVVAERRALAPDPGPERLADALVERRH